MCRGFILRVCHARHVVGVGDGVVRESMQLWSDYIAYNSERPNKICNKNIKKNIRGIMMSIRVTRHRCGHPQWEGHTLWRETLKAREEAEVGDQEGVTLWRETLMREGYSVPVCTSSMGRPYPVEGNT
jgi:hypothetical protein